MKKFKGGELVLVKKTITEGPSMIHSDEYWPAKVTQKLTKSKRQVQCYASQEKLTVLIDNIIPYNQDNLKNYFPKTRLNNNPELALAVEEIESNYVAKNRTAEQLNLSGEGKLFYFNIEEISGEDKGECLMMARWKSHVERQLGRLPGIGHLSQTVRNFASENKDLIVQEFYQDFIVHLCDMEQDNLISAIDVEQVMVILADQSIIDDVFPVLVDNISNDNSNSLLAPGGSRSTGNISENCGTSVVMMGTEDDALIDIVDEEYRSNTINEEVVVNENETDDNINDDQEEEVRLEILTDQGTAGIRQDDDPAIFQSFNDKEEGIEIIEVLGNKTFNDKVFGVGKSQTMKRKSVVDMDNSNKRQNSSNDKIDMNRNEQGDLANVRDQQKSRGHCRCCRTSIDGTGMAARSTNERKSVKMNINIEMPTETFVQMFKKIPNLLAKHQTLK